MFKVLISLTLEMRGLDSIKWGERLGSAEGHGTGLGSNWEEPEFRHCVTCPLIYEPGISGVLSPLNPVFGEQ
jgi:hypothetical protein